MGGEQLEAGSPSLSRNTASLFTFDYFPLSSAAVSEGGKNNRDLKGTEVLHGGVCALTRKTQCKQTHVYTCMHACIPVQGEPSYPSQCMGVRKQGGNFVVVYVGGKDGGNKLSLREVPVVELDLWPVILPHLHTRDP